jgi:TatD DNase family protein
LLFDAHTHHPQRCPGLTCVANLRYPQFPDGRADIFSAGLHPWFLEEHSTAAAEAWLQAVGVHPAVRAIGEAGLDKAAQTPWPLQLKAFQFCIELSETLHKPLIIHCVRAFDDLLALKKQYRPRQTWVLHGFRKNAATAQQLLSAGCWLSFGTALLLPAGAPEPALRAAAPGCFLLETDDAADADLGALYAHTAQLLHLPPEALERQLETNFKHIFG